MSAAQRLWDQVQGAGSRDHRHSQVTQLFVRLIAERMFLPWRLGFWENRFSALPPAGIHDVNAATAEGLLKQARSAMTLANRAPACVAVLDRASANGCTRLSRASGGAHGRAV